MFLLIDGVGSDEVVGHSRLENVKEISHRYVQAFNVIQQVTRIDDGVTGVEYRWAEVEARSAPNW
jgi:hypothetical protein